MHFIFANFHGMRIPIYNKSHDDLNEQDYQHLKTLQNEGYHFYFAQSNPGIKKQTPSIQTMQVLNNNTLQLGKKLTPVRGSNEEQLFYRWHKANINYDYPKWRQEKHNQPIIPIISNDQTQSIPSFLNYLNPVRGLRAIANRIFGNFLGKIILKAQALDFSQEIAKKDPFIFSHQHYLTIHQQKVISGHGAKLDTMELSTTAQDQCSRDKNKSAIYVINFVGYDMCYEQILNDMKNDVDDFAAQGLNAHVIGFNYRNVAESKGKVRSKDDLVQDGIAQVQALIDRGIKPENIKLKAYSLGGAIGTLVAEHFHKKGQHVYLFNKLSFSLLSTTVAEWIRTGKKSGYRDKNLLTKLTGIFTRPFIHFGLYMAKWEMNAAAAYKHIPKEYKKLIVVRSNKEIRRKTYRKPSPSPGHFNFFHIKDDATVGFRPSLYLMAKSEYSPKKRKKMKMSLAYNDDLNTDRYACNGHIASMQELKNREGVSAHTFFHRFISQAYKKHPELLIESKNTIPNKF